MSTRARQDILSIWTSNTESQLYLAKKLQEICNLDESTRIDYKTFRSAIKDGSSFRNTRSYFYTNDSTIISPGNVRKIIISI